MYLPAITLGYAVPAGNFDASVHSAFHSAMNLRLLNEKNLLTLVRSDEPDLPQGIRLDTGEGFTFENFQIGEPAICRKGILSFEKSGLTVPLRGARRWECDLSRPEIDTGNPAVYAAWSLVWETLNKRQKRFNAEIIAEDILLTDHLIQSGITSTAGKAMRELINGTQQFNLDSSTAVEALIGLGAGLTPSGDDLLAGYLAGLWCTVGRYPERSHFTKELGSRILILSGRTNEISSTYLFHAVHGHVSSRLTVLAEAIAHGEDTDRLLKKAEHAMHNGHTSGMDAVTGLLIGISAWSGILK